MAVFILFKIFLQNILFYETRSLILYSTISTMKLFKNTFGVTGSLAQMLAFAEYAASIGWKLTQHRPIQTTLFFCASDNKGWGADSSGCFWPPLSLTGTAEIIVYNLPEELKMAIAVLEEEIK